MTDIATLLKHAISTPGAGLSRVDAEFLLAHYLGKTRSWLYAHADQELAAQQCDDFDVLVQRRKQGEPVAYITGRRAFWSLDLKVTPDTLIPRPETELLVELALSRLHPASTAKILDLGTGSGAIALAIAIERPASQITAVDASTSAIAVAIDNANLLKLRNVRFEQGNWYSRLGGQSFDIIVSNPPYIEDADMHLGQGDLRFEPHAALASGADGLDDIRIIVSRAHGHLSPGGWLLIEHGWNQGEAVRALFRCAEFLDIETSKDLEQRDRVTFGRRS
jgi:release factor glutamine methyltransferase